MALRSNGSLVGWGYDNYGQASPPAGTDYVARLLARPGAQAGGSVAAWGYDGTPIVAVFDITVR